MEFLLFLHILGAILLLGNVLVTGLWAGLLWRAWPALPFRPAARAILRADLYFTVVGGSLLTLSGILLIQGQDLPWRELAWIQRGLWSLGVATAIWAIFLLPDQFRLDRLPETDPRYRTTFWRWTVIGWVDTGVLLYGLWAMVTKS